MNGDDKILLPLNPGFSVEYRINKRLIENNMILQHPNIFFRSNLEPLVLAEVLGKSLVSVNSELNRIAKAFYSFGPGSQSMTATDHLFTIIERTWMGVFTSALKAVDPEMAIMQEFSVWEEDRSIGRCDLLFRVYDGSTKIDILAEAKCSEFLNNWDYHKSREFYLRVLSQAYKYYSTERKYYDSEVYLVAIIFEWIRTGSLLQKAKEIMDCWNKDTDPETDFITLYSASVRGAFLYGKIMSVKEYERECQFNESFN